LEKTIGQFVGDTNFLAAAEKWTPHLLEEVRGIAQGAGVGFNAIFGLQLMDEGAWYLNPVQRDATQRCSSLGCDRDGDRPALLGQNLDWTNLFEGLAVLLHVKYPQSSLEVLAPTIPGVIGTCGLNNRSIGVCTNALWRALNSSVDGLPVNFIVRAVLEQDDLDGATNLLHNVQHASGENFMIGDAERVATFECSAHKVVRYVPYEGARSVYHTNHPLANDDLIFPSLQARAGGTSYERFRYLEYRLKDPYKIAGVETFKYILSSHQGPICVHHNHQAGEGYTFCSAIYVLSSFPELHLTVGPPCCNTYSRFTF
ncbi:MAG: hypothetical protein GY832_07335, partial [Chloroflexi bacterium]|nr:hypothetical protein [Chloroflexota bacterium]